MRRKVRHLSHTGDNECDFTITESIEEFNIREEVRDLLIEKIRITLNFILNIK